MAGKLLQYKENRYQTRSNEGSSVNPTDSSNAKQGGVIMNLTITPTNSSSIMYVRFCCPVAGETSNNSNHGNWLLYHSQGANDSVILHHHRARYKSGGKPSWMGGANHCFPVDMQAWVSLGNTTATEFEVRAGCDAGAMTINGVGSQTPTAGTSQTLMYIMEFEN